MKFSSKVEKCQLSPIRKFHPYALAARQKGRTIYHLNIGQPDIETPAPYFNTVQGFHLPVLEYAPSPGIPELIEAIRGYYARLGIQLEPDDILITTGGSEALSISLCCVLDNDDEVLVPEPFYPNYNTFVQTTGASIRPIPTVPEDGYHYADRAKIESQINAHTRAILVTNPGNPTGSVLSREEMQMLADVARKHDLFLISDEVYREFVYGGEDLSCMLQCSGAEENTIIVDSVSKRFSACGARIGILISKNRQFMDHAMKYCQARLSVATLDQLGAAAFYGVRPDYFASVRAEYRRRRDTVMDKLSRIPGVVCACPEGAFYVMVKLPVDDTEAFQQWLLEEFEDHGDTVMFAPGNGVYATPGAGKNEIRIAYVLKEENLARAMDLLALGIEQYQKLQSGR